MDTVDLPAIKGSLDRLTELAKEHPDLTQGTENWSDHLDELDRLTMPAKTPKERQKSYRDKLRAAGYRSITVWLDAGTIAAIERRLHGRESTRKENIAAVISEAMQALEQQEIPPEHTP